MDTNNKRYEAEHNLSDKLKNHKAEYKLEDLAAFENFLDRSGKSNFKIIFFWAFVSLVLLSTFTYFLTTDKNDATNLISETNETQILNDKNSDELQKGTINESKLSSTFDEETANNSQANTVVAERIDDASYSSQKRNSISTISESQIKNNENSFNSSLKGSQHSQHTNNLESVREDKVNTSDESKSNLSLDSNSNNLTSGSVEDNKTMLTNSTKDNILKSSSPQNKSIALLAKQLPEVVSLIKRRNNPEALNNRFKTSNYFDWRRLSFGFIYNLSYTEASSHQTPFTSPFETRIEGGSSFGVGLFGMYDISEKDAIKSSFTYNSFKHKQFVEGLNFPSGPTSLIMNYRSHELRFGLDYLYRLYEGSRSLSISPGVGMAYHHSISGESDNYFLNPDLEELVDNLNEIDIAPISFKLFVGMEKNFSNNIIFGIEPYITYHSRKVNYNPSIELADEGKYNINYGLNFTLRFN